MSTFPLISVIVCCHDEPFDIVRAAVLSVQKTRGVPQEIILCANGKEDYTPLHREHLVDTCIQLQENHGIAQLRNAGLHVRKASLVFFLDGHMIIKDWQACIPTIQAIFAEDPSIGIVTGIYKAQQVNLGDQARQLIYTACANKSRLSVPTTSHTCWLTTTGGISIFRDELFSTLGDFPLYFQGASCEDIYMQLRAEAHGWFVAVCPQLRGTHIHPMTLRAFYKNCLIRNGRGEALLFLAMLAGHCKARISGYVCEIPIWSVLFLLALVSVITTRNPTVFFGTAFLSICGLMYWLRKLFMAPGRLMPKFHAILGYSGQKLAKLVWIVALCPQIFAVRRSKIIEKGEKEVSAYTTLRHEKSRR